MSDDEDYQAEPIENPDDDEADFYFQRLLEAREDRLYELRNYADERELHEIHLKIPYCNPIRHCADYLSNGIDPDTSYAIALVVQELFLINIYESPLLKLQRQAKEYNINHIFNIEEPDSDGLYQPILKFCEKYDPFKNINQVLSKLMDDDRALSWNYAPRVIEVKLGDIKQQLSLRTEYKYIGMFDYKIILAQTELLKYENTKGYLGKDIEIDGFKYIVWINEEEFPKLGMLCNELDAKLEVFKQECTKISNQFITEYRKKQEELNKCVVEKYENSVKENKKQQAKIQEDYDREKEQMLGLSSLFRPKKPVMPEKPKMPKKPEVPEVSYNEARRILIGILSNDNLRLESKKQISSIDTNKLIDKKEN